MTKKTVCIYPVTEENDPIISILNCLHLANMHGSIVGVIHQINPRLDNNTFVFFNDGYVHVANGFRTGEINDESKDSICGLYTILNMIPYLSPHILVNSENIKDVPFGCVDISLYGDKKTLSEMSKNNKTINYIFRLPSETPEDIIDCDGMKTLDNQIHYLSLDKTQIIEEGAW